MKVIVVGYGVQGVKRKKTAGKDFFASVDPYKKNADFKDISDVDDDKYNAALLCVPDEQKVKLIKFFADRGKHVLVEKPLFSKNFKLINELEKKFKKNNLVLYSAYNHRFEPHFRQMKKLIQSKRLGRIYYCKMFYGNGTAKLVKNSPWRDRGLGVITDLGSHLLDTIDFWFNLNDKIKWKLSHVNYFENNSPDHAIITSIKSKLFVELEMSLCMWRNHFTCDVIGEKGSAHIESLCKWGPSKFVYRKRKFPSGKPIENVKVIKMKDPTWNLEYDHFKKLIKNKSQTSLKSEIIMSKTFIDLKKQLR